MTVCVATMANDGSIFGASDRMLTFGQKESEPSITKIYHSKTFPVSVMWAGASVWHAEALALMGDITIHAEPWCVRDYVHAMSRIYLGLRAEMGERQVLAPLRMALPDLAKKGRSALSRERVEYLTERLIAFEPPPEYAVECLIAGVDEGGAHLWVITNGFPVCWDMQGYAAIGVGAEEAVSQLRFADFTPRFPPRDAMLLTFVAKKRAENMAGVGRATDMFARVAYRSGAGDAWRRAHPRN